MRRKDHEASRPAPGAPCWTAASAASCAPPSPWRRPRRRARTGDRRMALDFDALVGAMTAAGQGAAGAIWGQMQSYAIPELKKIAIQIVAIGENVADYTVESARILLQ